MTPDEVAALQVAMVKIALEEEWLQKIIVLPTGIKVVTIFSEDELKGYQEQFQQGQGCTHCGGLHLRACRRVRKLVMKNSEELAEVEFWPDGKWDESGIVWPEDVYEEMPEDGEKDGPEDD